MKCIPPWHVFYLSLIILNNEPAYSPCIVATTASLHCELAWSSILRTSWNKFPIAALNFYAVGLSAQPCFQQSKSCMTVRMPLLLPFKCLCQLLGRSKGKAPCLGHIVWMYSSQNYTFLCLTVHSYCSVNLLFIILYNWLSTMAREMTFPPDHRCWLSRTGVFVDQ